MFPKYHPDFITITCRGHEFLLADDAKKDMLVDSLRFLVKKERVIVFAFVIMSNHFHMIWQMLGDHEPGNVQCDFLKYTARELLKGFRNEDNPLLSRLVVNKADRKNQVWERDSLRIPLWSDWVFNQKLDYIHMNPVKARLCAYPEDYKYSSARYYLTGERDWDFLTHAGPLIML